MSALVLVEWETVDETPVSSSSLLAPPLDAVNPRDASGGLDGFIQPRNPARQPSADGTTSSFRRTRRSKQIGDRAEEVVIKWLQAKLEPMLTTSITWVAQQGKTPGWDIEFVNEHGDTVSVEVKGTTGSVFQSVEITAQEWTAAQVRREKYWLVLVTACLSSQPTVHLIPDPYGLLANGNLEITPVLWRLRRV